MLMGAHCDTLTELNISGTGVSGLVDGTFILPRLAFLSLAGCQSLTSTGSSYNSLHFFAKLYKHTENDFFSFQVLAEFRLHVQT